jgi:uncharacterized repeat protein (TIGR03803 family)
LRWIPYWAKAVLDRDFGQRFTPWIGNLRLSQVPHMSAFRAGRFAPSLLVTVLLAACGSEDSGPPPTYTVGGTVTGLNAAAKVTLLNNGGSPLVINANGSFQLASSVVANGSYAITVGADPVAQTCTVTHASASALQADVANVAVNCSASTDVALHALNGTTDGGASYPGLILARDGNLYGATCEGGNMSVPGGAGTLFRVTRTGSTSTYEVLYTLDGTTDGNGPNAKLLQGADGSFYGTTNAGGDTTHSAGGAGVIFKLTPSGNTFTYSVLYALNGTTDGIAPQATLMQAADGSIYGTALFGGSPTAGAGTVFKLTPSGSGYAFSVVYTFTGGTDGGMPAGGLMQATDGSLYGTTFWGGNPTTSAGTIYRLGLAGSTATHTVLHALDGTAEGSRPQAVLTQGTDGRLYGTASGGGDSSTTNTIWSVSPTATTDDFRLVYTLNGTTDGQFPFSQLVQASDGSFYGTTSAGGDASANAGTLYKLTVTSTTATYTVLHALDGTTDGSNAYGGLVVAPDGHFYGMTTNGGGSANAGTLFRF